MQDCLLDRLGGFDGHRRRLWSVGRKGNFVSLDFRFEDRITGDLFPMTGREYGESQAEESPPPAPGCEEKVILVEMHVALSRSGMAVAGWRRRYCGRWPAWPRRRRYRPWLARS